MPECQRPLHLLLLAASSLASASAQCAGSSWAFAAGVTQPCCPATQVLGSARACSPGAASVTGSTAPTDTSFLFTNDQVTDIFLPVGAAGLTAAPDRLGFSSIAALSVAPGSRFDVKADAVGSALPSGSAAATVSAWVKCPPSSGSSSVAVALGVPPSDSLAAPPAVFPRFGVVVTSNASAPAGGASAFSPVAAYTRSVAGFVNYANGPATSGAILWSIYACAVDPLNQILYIPEYGLSLIHI